MRRVWQGLLLLLAIAIAWQWLRGAFPGQERQLRSTLREQVTASYPEATRRVQASMGLRLHADSPADAVADVVLIHGLDDPGRVWMNLAPALAAAGYRTWLMTYPNDQPITDSARLFAQHLATLTARGVDQLSIVAHSMGGLVAREMLTDPRLACDGDAACARPRVASLVMIGTPNHGSAMARLRGLAEVREQFVKIFDEDSHWLRFIIDGAGEAGLELLPGSDFLQRLNARQRPTATRYLVIAGVLEPVERRLLTESLAALTARLPEASPWLDDLLSGFDALRAELGDGLVPLPSAQLAGVPLCIVNGNHLSIVRNVFAASPRVPPAVPLVLQTLAGGGAPPAVAECRAAARQALRTNK